MEGEQLSLQALPAWGRADHPQEGMTSLKEMELHLYRDNREQHPSTFHKSHKRIQICNKDIVLWCDPNLLTLYLHPVLNAQQAMPGDSECVLGLTAPLPFQSCTYPIPVWTVGTITPPAGAAGRKNASLSTRMREAFLFPHPVLSITVHLSVALAMRQAPTAPMALAEEIEPIQQHWSTWEKYVTVVYFLHKENADFFSGMADFWIKMHFSLSCLS